MFLWLKFFFCTRFGWFLLPILILFFINITPLTIIIFWVCMPYHIYRIFIRPSDKTSIYLLVSSDRIIWSFVRYFIFLEPYLRPLNALYAIKDKKRLPLSFKAISILVFSILKNFLVFFILQIPIFYIKKISLFIQIYNTQYPKNLAELKDVFFVFINL